MKIVLCPSPDVRLSKQIATVKKHLIYFIIWQSKSERSDWFFLGRDFAIRTVSVETVISCVFFVSKAGKFKTSMARMPYNKLLTNLASSSRTGEYWPSVVSVQISLRSVRTATTSGQYSPVQPSRSVSKRLISNCSEYRPNNSINISTSY